MRRDTEGGWTTQRSRDVKKSREKRLPLREAIILLFPSKASDGKNDQQKIGWEKQDKNN